MLFFKGRDSNARSGSRNMRFREKRRSLCFEPLERRDLLSLPASGADLDILQDRGFSSDSESGTIFITTLEDKVDANDGLISLREAVGYANQTGTKIEFDVFGTTFLQSTLSINKSLTINESGKHTITLDGSKSTEDSCFINISAFNNLSELKISFQNFSFKDCRNVSNGGAVSVGAKCNVIFENCFFLNNTSESDGGAIYFAGRGSLSHTVVQANSAMNGGAIAFGGSQSNTTLLDSSIFKDNTASEKGGTLYYNQGSYSFSSLSDSTSLLEIKGSEVSNSSAKEGGAFWFDNVFCTISDTDLLKNYASEKGGAVYVGDNGYLLIEQSTLDSNTTNGTGGALFNNNILYSNGNTYSRNSAFSQLQSELNGSGGAITNIYLFCSRGDQIRENSAMDRGAGLINYYYIDNNDTIYGKSQLIDVSLENNRSEKEGGAIYNYGHIDLANSLVSGNSGSTGGGIYSVSDSELNIFQSVFTDNIASNSEGGGGGIDNCGKLTISDSSFMNNQAGIYSNKTGSGGAINNNYFGNLSISDSRFIANTAYKGGAIYDSAPNDSVSETANVDITDSIFQRNCDSSGSGFVSEHYPLLDSSNTQSANISTPNTIFDSLVLYDAYDNIVSGSINFGAIAQSSGSWIYTYKIVNQSSDTVQMSSIDTFDGPGIYYSLEESENSVLAPGESRKLTFTITPETLGSSSMFISFKLANAVFQINAALTVVENAATVSASAITLSSDSSTGSYTLKLNKEPQSDVKVLITAPEGIILDTTELIFTSANYGSPQMVSFHWDPGKLAAFDEPIERAFLSHILVYDIDNIADNEVFQNLMISDKEIDLSYTIAFPGASESDPAALKPKMPELLIADTFAFGENDEVLKISVNVQDVGRISNWQLDWGDGSLENHFFLSSRIKMAHYYSTSGNYDITLKMFDKNGNALENIYYLGNHIVSASALSSMLPNSEGTNEESLAVIESVLANWSEEELKVDLLAKSFVSDPDGEQVEMYSIFTSDFLTEKNKKNGLFTGDFLDF